VLLNYTKLGNPVDAIIVGGAGFIGSHFVDRFLDDPEVVRVTVFDNFCSGRKWHIENRLTDQRFRLVDADIRQVESLVSACEGHSTLIHLASNPDIAAAVNNPAIDFDHGTLLTHLVVEAARIANVTTFLYASGSGVYGDLGKFEVDENYGPLEPVSTYAASKIAGEALLSAYAHMFDICVLVFRFGNVVGPRQTHGVGLDFLRKLRNDQSHLEILGDGTQSKSYVHVQDVVDAVLLANFSISKPYEVFNVATTDYVTVTEIAGLACVASNIEPTSVRYVYSGGDKGWRGDVPVIRLSSRRIREIGWIPKMVGREALKAALESMVCEPRIMSN